MLYTDEKLRSLTAAERATVRSHAAKRKDAAAVALVQQIDALGLPLRTGGMTRDDPVFLEMEAVIWSAEAKAAALEAVAQGQPALAGVDPILQREMGPRYTPHHQGTVNAGIIVGNMMIAAGYEIDGEAKLPAGCVAKTAAKWKPRIKR